MSVFVHQVLIDVVFQVRVKVRPAVGPGLNSDWTGLQGRKKMWPAKGSKIKRVDRAATDAWTGPLTHLIKEKSISWDMKQT